MGIIPRPDTEEDRVPKDETVERQQCISLDNESLKNTMVSSPIAPQKKQNSPAKKWYAEARKWDNISNRKRVGQRNIRREENLNFLMDLGGDADMSDYVQLTEPSCSSFAVLFMEQEKMRLWYDFINWSEDEQEKFMRGGVSPWPCFCDGDDVDDIEVIEYLREKSDDSFQLIDDNRSVHPAFSAKECFHRIDHNLKAVLKKRHLPLGKLLAIEKEVTDFFRDFPTSVYILRLANSYERMLLHCLCQYLDLKSHSFDSNEGVRQTEVENKHRTFLLPDVSLTQYLEDKRYTGRDVTDLSENDDI